MAARDAVSRFASWAPMAVNPTLRRLATCVCLTWLFFDASPFTASVSAMGPDRTTATVMQADGQSADPLLDQQWHLTARNQEPAGANVQAVWPISKGDGIVIGIVDDGLQYTHPDLQANYLAPLSWDFDDNDSDPGPDIAAGDFHGTAVAGIAAARGENGIGVSGAAPSASLAGLRLIGAPVSDAQVAAALGHQLDAIHILNNSWGPPDNGRTVAGPGPLAQAAIETAVGQGRNGKGRVFLWAAGNGLAKDDNCNFNGFANNRFVMAVGALADTAQQAPYSEPCSAMFVTAPSSGGARGITTTDLAGTPGYGSGDYTDVFGGTSATTPLVSGIVALMLAENPSLSWRDVQHILARSAIRVNPADIGWTVGTFAHNERFGFGLVDGQAAVNLATAWSHVPDESAVPAVARAIARTIPDGNPVGLIDSITIDNAFVNFAVEHVEVEFDATHPYRGDLEVTLTSPAGVVSRLATVRDLDSGENFSFWRFGSVRHWGESAAGTWTLRVSDLAQQDVGTWNSWTLRIYGIAGPPPLGVTTGSLPVGERGVHYRSELSSEGGTPPYLWSLVKGKLPAGLILDSAGVISGIPMKAKTAKFTVQVVDGVGASARRSVSLKIVKPVRLTTDSLSRGRVGTPYSVRLKTKRGILPLTFSIVDGSLPQGLTLDQTAGQISGVPTVAGTFNFQVMVVSSGGSSDQKDLRIKIK